jgi:hypothetical protein
MPNSREIKAMLKPLLQRRPDLAYDRRVLFFTPLTHYLRGVAFVMFGFMGDFTIVSFAAPLFEAHANPDFDGSRGQYDELICYSTTEDRQALALDLCDRLERDALPPVRDIVDPRVHESRPAYFGTDLNDPRGIPPAYRLRAALGACYYGDYDRALKFAPNGITEGDLAPKEPVTEGFRYHDSLFYRGAYLSKLLRGDRASIPQLLHDWERFSVQAMKLKKWWKPTPFPCESRGTRT